LMIMKRPMGTPPSFSNAIDSLLSSQYRLFRSFRLFRLFRMK